MVDLMRAPRAGLIVTGAALFLAGCGTLSHEIRADKDIREACILSNAMCPPYISLGWELHAAQAVVHPALGETTTAVRLWVAPPHEYQLNDCQARLQWVLREGRPDRKMFLCDPSTAERLLSLGAGEHEVSVYVELHSRETIKLTRRVTVRPHPEER